MMMRRFLSALVLVSLVTQPIEAYQGPKKPLCASCGLNNTTIPTVQDEYGFTEFMFDQPIIGSTPIDLADDGVWELAVMLGGTILQGIDFPQRVGVLNLRKGSWADGPHTLPVTNSKWGAAEVGAAGSLHYYYFLDQAIRDFSASEQTDSVLLNLDFVPTSIIIWGHEDGQPLIGVRMGGTGNVTCSYPHNTWYIYRTRSADLTGTVPGATGAISRLRSSPEADDELGFLVSAGAVTSPGPSTHWCAWSDSYSERWLRTDTRTLPVVFQTGLGPTPLSLISAVSSWQENGSGANVWYTAPGGYPYGITSYYLFATGGADWIIQFSGYSGKFTSVATADIDADGDDELLLPFTSTSQSTLADWEVRSSVTGLVIDTLRNMPSAYLNSGPYRVSNQNSLIYTKGASLFLSSHGSTLTSVDEQPESSLSVSSLKILATPNPFNAAVVLSWTESKPIVTLALYNILGQTVRTFDESVLSGNSTITWDGLDGKGRQVTSGVYFARLVTGDQVATAKLVLLR